METIFKTLYGTISANSNTISFTDDLIIDSTIIDTYFSDDEIVVDDISVTNHTVTITIKDHSASVGIAVFINNCEEFIPFDDTEILNRLTIVETDTDTLNTEIGELDTEVDTLTSTVNNKQDKLPTVVNDRYLHTNSVTGNLEWSTVQGGGSVSSLADLNDIKLTLPLTESDILYFSTQENKWVNVTLASRIIDHYPIGSSSPQNLAVFVNDLSSSVTQLEQTVGQVNTLLESV